ncbi:hypothetical protein ACNKHR_05040 [Shigella flexneri]
MAKSLARRFIAFLAGLPLLLIAGLIHLALGWLKAYQQKLASAVGSLRNDSQLNTPKAILIDLIRALPVCRMEPRLADSVTMQLNISELRWSFSKKLARFWLVFGLCWKVLEKRRCRTSLRHAGTHQPRRRKLSASVSRRRLSISGCGGRTFPAASDG